MLAEAKDELEPGSFEAVVKRHFDLSYARKLRIIAEHPVISNRAHVHALPPSVFVLYELTKLPAALLRDKLADGRNANGIVASVNVDTTMMVPGMPMRSMRNPATGGETAAAPIDNSWQSASSRWPIVTT